MDFEDTPEEAEFRAEVKAWLAEQAAEYDLSNHGELSVDQQLALGRAFQARKADRGYAKVTWPTELGGMGGTPMQAVIYDQEEKRPHQRPSRAEWSFLGSMMAAMCRA